MYLLLHLESCPHTAAIGLAYQLLNDDGHGDLQHFFLNLLLQLSLTGFLFRLLKSNEILKYNNRLL